MDASAFVTVAATFVVAIICGIVTYRISIRQAKEEIATAFQEHIERMHNEHQQFVDSVETPKE